MLKKPLSFLIAFLLLLLGMHLTDVHALAAEDAPVYDAARTIPNIPEYPVNAKGAVVMEADSGRVLYAKNADGRLPMASTTKIMTALLTLEQPNLEEFFVVDSNAVHVEGSSMGLLEGDRASLLALSYGMLLPSGNDGANAAAVRIAGSNAQFAVLMNQRAAEIGMNNTHFVTPSGLDDPAHYSTAYDMALLAREALGNLQFANICAQSRAVVRYGNPPYERWLKNHNRLLKECEGVIGVKTGFTKKAGRCLVSAAMRNGVRLIVVTLNCPDDWKVHRELYDRYFALLHPMDVSEKLSAVSIPVVGGTAVTVEAAYLGSQKIPMLPQEQVQVVITAPKLLFAPVQEGQVIANAAIYLSGEPAAELPLSAQKSIEATTKERQSLWQKLFAYIK